MDAQSPFDISRWLFLTGTTTFFLGVSLFLHGCDRMEAKKAGELVTMKETKSISNLAIPPIDRSAPLKTETATFALG
jgi:hypothetical protein